ncbi:hypothetical protein RF11_07734 [Thelohanellus kitauei]|uniref:Uncharacterized protein n=1 Tax=Thelohanellus kitauei TaxID=669202 RepID=A0A0C2MJI1_THEKT|nr:hypothetical protein RF11_07734 [Thelohanellus kitauei]
MNMRPAGLGSFFYTTPCYNVRLGDMEKILIVIQERYYHGVAFSDEFVINDERLSIILKPNDEKDVISGPPIPNLLTCVLVDSLVGDPIYTNNEISWEKRSEIIAGPFEDSTRKNLSHILFHDYFGNSFRNPTIFSFMTQFGPKLNAAFIVPELYIFGQEE